jgi:hypothetical protein
MPEKSNGSILKPAPIGPPVVVVVVVVVGLDSEAIILRAPEKT